MITGLTLKNYRQHQSFSADFAPGLNIICGPNWAGKTSVMTAILYGLFGARAVPGKANDLITFGEPSMEVELKFEVDGHQLRVRRTHTGARLYNSEKLLASGQAPVTAEIEAALGTEAKDFLAFHVTAQEEASSLLTLNTSILNGYVSRITGMDVVDKALELCREKAAEMRGALGVQRDMSQIISELAAQMDKNLQLSNRMQADRGLLKQQLGLRNKQYGDLRQELAEMQEAGKKYDAFLHEQRVLVGVLKAKEEALREAEGRAVERPMNLNELRQTHAELLARQRQYEDYHKRAERFQVELSEAHNAIAQAHEACSELKCESPTALFQSILADRAKLESLDTELSKLVSGIDNSICNYCMRPFEGADIEGLKREQERVEKIKEELENRLGVNEEEHGRQNDQYQRYQQAKDLLDQWISHQDRLKQEEQSILRSKVESVPANELTDMANLVHQQEEKERQYQAYQEDSNRRRDEVVVVKEKIEQLGVCPPRPSTQRLNELTRHFETLGSELTVEGARLQQLESQISQLQTEFGNLKSGMAKLQAEQDSYLANKTRQERLAKLSKFLRDNSSKFTSSVWHQLLGLASEFIKQATQGSVTAISRDEKGKFHYLEGNRSLPIEGNASGMQKAIFSTGVKLALGMALGSKFRVLMFDEVSAAASDETSLLFTQLLARYGEQVVLVTHRPADSVVANSLISLQ